MTDAPPTITFASVVARETMRIALTLAGLNDLEVKVSDIENAYITAPCTEKIWTVLGPEFGSDAGKQAIVICELYGLKSAGASFLQPLGRLHESSWVQTLPCRSRPLDDGHGSPPRMVASTMHMSWSTSMM